jgi:hypothetical protein
MARHTAISHQATVLAAAFFVPLAICLAYQSASQRPKTSAGALTLTTAEEKDSYEIYSLLLKEEMPPQWNVTTWFIRLETQTYPHELTGVCLEPSDEQKDTYLPAIKDYVTKNSKELVLKRRFGSARICFDRT